MKLVPVILSACLSSALAASTFAAIPTPLVPSGTVVNRYPTFKWTDTGAAQFTVELTKDDSLQTKHVVSAPKLAYPEGPGLGVGVYAWRVKEGNIASASPWSAPLAFTVPPYEPDPVSPVNLRYPGAPTAPTFNWSSIDPDANRFTIQLYQDGSLVGATNVNITKDKTIGMLATWPSALPAGTYEWRIRATRKSSNSALTLSSPWSEFNTFSVGVPLPCVITKPEPNTPRSPGTFALTIIWTPASGAAMYNIKILQNGSVFTAYSSFTTNGSTVQAWTPARYSIIVTPMNAFGDGKPSAPRNFVVERFMTPGHEVVLADPPNRLNWTRSADCTRYRLRLFKSNPATGVYDLLKEGSVNQPIGQPFWKPGTLVTGAYKWQVTDFKNDKALYTSTDYFSIGVPGRPNLLGTTDKKIAGLIGLRLAWKALGGSPSHYQQQVWRNDVLIKDSGWKVPADFAKASSYSQTFNLSAAGPGDYLWRVRAKNAQGAGGWSQRTHQIAALAQAVVYNPANGRSVAQGSTVGVQWYGIAGASRFEIEFWRNGSREEFVIQAATYDLPEGTQLYLWTALKGTFDYRIRAVQTGYGPWSTPRTITGL
jgi:hypothetical protein